VTGSNLTIKSGHRPSQKYVWVSVLAGVLAGEAF
jgi:hypothetical protein